MAAMSREIGIEEARKVLGDLVADATSGVDVVLTHYRTPVARIVPIQSGQAELARARGARTIHDHEPAAYHGLLGIDPDRCWLCQP